MRLPATMVLMVSMWAAAADARAGGAPQDAGVPAAQGGQPPPIQQPAPVDLLWRTEGADDSTPLFSLVGLNVGADQGGDLTVTGRGRFFAPFGRRSALQIEGTYDWYHDRREGQLDVGLVNRVDRVQVGVFASVRHISLDEFDASGSLSQAGATVDYVLPAGRLGVFITAGLRDTDVLARTLHRHTAVERSTMRLADHNFFDEVSLRLVDQFGLSGRFDVARAQVDGHLAFLRPAGRPATTGGSVRLAYPVSERWAVTAEGAWHRSLVTSPTERRFTVGMQMGDWPSSRVSTATAHPLPIDIPSIRYQALTRLVRSGNDAPVADAGPDQEIVPKCGSAHECLVEVKLDAYGSFDPDGDPLTFLWTPRSGFTDERFTMPRTGSWTAFEGKTGHRYVIRLEVTDDRGAKAFDEVTVTILQPRR